MSIPGDTELGLWTLPDGSKLARCPVSIRKLRAAWPRSFTRADGWLWMAAEPLSSFPAACSIR